MRFLLLLIALTAAGCGDDNADQLCIRHSNCAMGWYCSQGVCRDKTPAPVVVADAGSPADSGLADAATGDALSVSDASSSSDASVVSDVSSSSDASDVQTDAALGDVALTDAAVSDVAPGDAALADAASATDASTADADQVGDASPQDAGPVDPSPDAAAPQDSGPDPGPLDVPVPDLAPDAGITDRGFGSFPLPSFDTGFGKPR